MKIITQKKKSLLKQIEEHSEFVRGSINSVCVTCNRANCICDKKSSRKAYRLTYKNRQQKTKIVYIPKDRLPKMQEMVANYKQVREIIEQLVELNIEAFKKQGASSKQT